MKYNIPVILGTTRKGNQSKKVAQYLSKKIKEHPEIESQLLDLEQAQFPMLEERIGSWENPPQLLLEWIEIFKKADAIIIVAPEYRNAYPGSLKNLLDLLPPGVFKYKPVGISTVSSGVYGGTNCLAQLRLVCCSSGGLPIPDRLQIANVVHAFDEQGELKNEQTIKVAEKFLTELIKYTQALSDL